MDPLLIVSPHLDDAVLSCGQLMAGRPDVTVATVFTGIPKRARTLTTYDRDCGFTSAKQAITERKRENFNALLSLDAAAPVYFELLDVQYLDAAAVETNESVAARRDEITAQLIELNNALRPTRVIGPVGIKHPDHMLVALAFREFIATAPEVDSWLYEDLPSRVLYPLETMLALQSWNLIFQTMSEGFLGTGDLAAKKAAVDCYRSQLWALDVYGPHPYLVPERFWQLKGMTE